MTERGKKLTIGILAHVDAGKTTLAECMLYLGGQLKKMGRVDHQDAFLDHFALERERGITIFSKQARFQWKNVDFTLLDTPGHVDFCAETERTLQVLDYAVLVISAADGVQGHTRTLWKLLKHYEVPVFLFVNKMDQPAADESRLMRELKEKLNANCVCFHGWRQDDVHMKSETDAAGVSGAEGVGGSEDVNGVEDADGIEDVSGAEDMWEEIATCHEELMNLYLETGELPAARIAQAVAERQVFPCFFGAALHGRGVEELLDGIAVYGMEQEYPEEFGARVYQINRDASGCRLTHIKVTGGSLRVKSMIDNHASAGSDEDIISEKADQLRLYNGTGYVLTEEVSAGEICAVTGLEQTFVGQGLGEEAENAVPVLEPVLTYKVELPEGMDAVRAFGMFRQLAEEEPLLHVIWQEEKKEIHVQVMGEVQIEVLEALIRERFGWEAGFGEGSIVYKETLAAPVIGYGHFEPLRHYAEVELLLEPGERGSGLQVASLCSEDVLDRNWQRLILTHLEEKVHAGVLTGAPITDLRVILIGGKAHLKHTEGGDFRQATYRALRQGLRSGESVLLEPMFSYELELPTEYLGRAMSDLQRMCASFDPPKTHGDRSVLTGRAPVSEMRDYAGQVSAYTHGEGHLSCVAGSYEPCHNAEEVIAQAAYDPEADQENPTGSVFCAHGAGFLVEWDKVPEYAHVEVPDRIRRILEEGEETTQIPAAGASAAGTADAGLSATGVGGSRPADSGRPISQTGSAQDRYITQEEIEAIFQQTYGAKRKDEKHRRRYHITHRDPAGGTVGKGSAGAYSGGGVSGAGGRSGKKSGDAPKKSCLLVDGYNIIFAWDELRELSKVSIDSARDRLMDIMSNYRGTLGGELILVFDAYKVKGNPGSVQKYHNIYVVYTKEAETADQYIEKTVHEMADKYQITVATSDALEQMIIWGGGALRMSARGLYEAVENNMEMLRRDYMGQ